MNLTRRFVLASATAGLVPSSFASELAVDEKVVAVAKYGGRDVAWEIALTAKYTAKFKAEINGGPTGIIAGDFRFYDTDILQKGGNAEVSETAENFLCASPADSSLGLRDRVEKSGDQGLS